MDVSLGPGAAKIICESWPISTVKKYMPLFHSHFSGSRDNGTAVYFAVLPGIGIAKVGIADITGA